MLKVIVINISLIIYPEVDPYSQVVMKIHGDSLFKSNFRKMGTVLSSLFVQLYRYTVLFKPSKNLIEGIKLMKTCFPVKHQHYLKKQGQILIKKKNSLSDTKDLS